MTAELERRAAAPAELSQRLRLLRRRRLSRQLWGAARLAAWLAVSLVGIGCLVASILAWAT